MLFTFPSLEWSVMVALSQTLFKWNLWKCTAGTSSIRHDIVTPVWVQFSSVQSFDRSGLQGGHEEWFGGDPFPLISAGGSVWDLVLFSRSRDSEKYSDTYIFFCFHSESPEHLLNFSSVSMSQWSIHSCFCGEGRFILEGFCSPDVYMIVWMSTW